MAEQLHLVDRFQLAHGDDAKYLAADDFGVIGKHADSFMFRR